jgi:hypothetical protein
MALAEEKLWARRAPSSGAIAAGKPFCLFAASFVGFAAKVVEKEAGLG